MSEPGNFAVLYIQEKKQDIRQSLTLYEAGTGKISVRKIFEERERQGMLSEQISKTH